MKILDDSDAALAQAVKALASDAVIAYPAETMYGLGVNPMSTAAIERLFEVKGRPESNPIPVIVADEDQMLALVRETSTETRKLMERFWPGPLSLVLPKARNVPDLLTAGRDDICIRCPASPIARALCARFGRGITSTSANRSGAPPIQNVEELNLNGVAVAINIGVIDVGPPSTIFDVASNSVLREGSISPATIAACLAK